MIYPFNVCNNRSALIKIVIAVITRIASSCNSKEGRCLTGAKLHMSTKHQACNMTFAVHVNDSSEYKH